MVFNISCIFGELDKKLAILGLIVSISLMVVSVDKYMYLFTGGLVLIACITWILIRKNGSFEFSILNRYHSHSVNLMLNFLFFILYACSILSIYFRNEMYERPIEYFVFIVILIGIVTLEILFTETKNSYKYFILIQIIAIGTSLAWSQLLLFPSLIGVDPWYHQNLTLKIITSSFIPEGYSYSKIPLFHLLIASTSLITGYDYKISVMLSASFAQIICNTVFIFLLTSHLLNNSKIGFLSSLLLIVSNSHIGMSYWSIPNSLAAIFIPIILYLHFKTKMEKPISSAFLSLVFMIAIILTHSLTSMCMMIILYVSWITSKFYNYIYSKNKITISLTYSILFCVITFSWWSYISDHIKTLGSLILNGFNSDFFSSTPNEIIFEISNNMTLLDKIFSNSTGQYLFFALSLIGFFYLISGYGNYFTFNMGIIAVTPLFLLFVTVITQHSIISNRWYYFAQILLSPLVAISILLIYSRIKNTSLQLSLLMFTTVFLAFLMIVSPAANSDSNYFSPNISARAALTTSELQTVQTIENIWNGDIKTDNYYSHSLSFSYPNYKPFDNEVYNQDFNDLDENFVLIRSDIINGPFRIFHHITILDYDLIDQLDKLYYSKLYESGSVSGFLKNN